MADKKITQLNNITGANLVDADEFVVVDVSADETKAITLGELKEAFDAGSGFVRVTGDTMTGDLNFGDNDKAIWGAGSDLQIYHNGSNQDKIESSSSFLILESSNIILRNNGGTEDYAKFFGDGAVELYSNNSKKLATTSTGVDITGTVTMDGGSTSADFNFGDNDKAIFGGGSDLQIYHDGSASYVQQTGAGPLNIQRDVTSGSISSGSALLNILTKTGPSLHTAANLSIHQPASTEGVGDFRFSVGNGAGVSTEILRVNSTGVDITGGLVVDATVPILRLDSPATTWSGGEDLGGVDWYTKDTSVGGPAVMARIYSESSGSNTLPIPNMIFQTSLADAAPKDRMKIQGNGDISFYEDTGTTPKFFWDASAESLGIGTAAPSAVLHVRNNNAVVIIDDANNGVTGTTYKPHQEFWANGTRVGSIGMTDSSNLEIIADDYNSASINFDTGGSEAMRITSAGNVGIGESSPSAPLHVVSTTGAIPALGAASSHAAIGSGGFGTMIGTKSTGVGYIQQQRFDGIANAYSLLLQPSGGNVGIGTSSPSAPLMVEDTGSVSIRVVSSDATDARVKLRAGGSSDINLVGKSNEFYVLDGSTERMRIDSSGNVGIGTSSPSDALHVVTSSFGGITLECTGATADPTFKFLGDSGNYWSLQQDTSQGDSFQFRYNNSVKVRITSSGNFLVGKTVADNGATVGLEYTATDKLYVTDSASSAIVMNRLASPGNIAVFQKDGVTVGSIGVASGDNFYIAGGSGSTKGIYFNHLGMLPADTGGALIDNTVDIGKSDYRFDDIYATNGTIQTSDRNEKQDIEVLTTAETAVAVACKGLLRKFRWIDSVTEKGDDARIHFGIIAQDLQDAFTAEGLDAGRYAMFISSTWWETQTDVPAVVAVDEVLDEDGNVVTEAVEAKDAYTRTDTFDTLAEAPEGATERTRLGVRYPELLAFIIAAI